MKTLRKKNDENRAILIHFKHLEEKEKLSYSTTKLPHSITVENNCQGNLCKEIEEVCEEEREWPLCKNGTEDLTHFVFHCEVLKDKRKTFLIEAV